MWSSNLSSSCSFRLDPNQKNTYNFFLLLLHLCECECVSTVIKTVTKWIYSLYHFIKFLTFFGLIVSFIYFLIHNTHNMFDDDTRAIYTTFKAYGTRNWKFIATRFRLLLLHHLLLIDCDFLFTFSARLLAHIFRIHLF
jgi:hypothetical protein